MSTLLRDSFCIDEYPEYEPLIQYVIQFFVQAKKRGRINLQSEIDKIISELFNINTAYAGKFRKFYFPSNRSRNGPEPLDKYLNRCKISHFNFKQMVSICGNNRINIPIEDRNKILLLSTFALPVSEILNEKSQYEIHADFKRKAEGWASEIDAIMKNIPDLKASIFMYLHQFRESEAVWWLLATLSSIDEEKIKKWVDSFRYVPSEKPILELVEPAKEASFLLDFYKKFPRLNASVLNTVYSNISGFDLFCAYDHIDCFKQFSHTPLRPDDILLTYLIITTLNECPQEGMLEQIAKASKANLPINFCPTDEVYIDWNSHTAW